MLCLGPDALYLSIFENEIFSFFLFQLSVHTLTTFSGTTNTGFENGPQS